MQRRAFWIGMLVLSVLSVRAVWVVRYLPTNDGPQNVLSAHIENHYADPGSVYADALRPAPQFAYKGFAAIYAPLESMLGWQDGLRVALALMILGLAWGFAALVVTLAPERCFLAWIGFVLAFAWPLYLGFFAYVIGSAIGLGVVALAIRSVTLDRKACLVLGAGLALDAVAHVATAAITGIIVAALLVPRAARGARVQTMVKVAAMAAPALVVFIAANVMHDEHGTAAHTPTLRVPLGEMLEVLPRLVAPGPPLRALMVSAVVALAIGLAVARARRLRIEERVLVVFGTLLLGIALFAPRDVPKWQHFSPRLVFLGAMMVVATLPLEIVRQRAAVGAVLFVAAAASTLLSASLHRRLADGCADALAGLDLPAKRQGYLLDITIDPYCAVPREATKSEVPWLEPLHSIGALYATAQGGLTPYLFVGSAAVHAFVPSGEKLPVPVPRKDFYVSALVLRRHDAIRELGAAGTFYESLLVAGATPEDVATLVDEGYAVDFSRGTFLLAHFDPCKLEVSVPPSADRVEIGVTDEPIASVAAKDGRATFPRAPCGDVWVRVKGAACTQADPEGRIVTRIARPARTVNCEVE